MTDRPLPDDYALDIPEIMERAKVRRSFVFQEIREGRLRSRKAGRRTIVLASDFRDWLRNLPVNERAA
jgi:hypothetical protein